MIERVDQCRMQSLILVRWRTPKQKWINVQRYVFTEKRNGEVNFGLSCGNPVIISKPGTNKGHRMIKRERAARGPPCFVFRTDATSRTPRRAATRIALHARTIPHQREV